jgi:hypothetical protein
MSAQTATAKPTSPTVSALDSRGVLIARAAQELFFAVVGPVGAGSSHVARQLTRCLKEATLGGVPFTCEMLKASDVIRASYGPKNLLEAALRHLSPLKTKVAMQEKGDKIRINDHAAIAASLIGKIAEARAAAQGAVFRKDAPIEPDGKPRAYVIDSLKHPAEVRLLRRLYGDAFVLIGVVCSPPTLERRLSDALFTGVERNQPSNKTDLKEFIKRDADDADHKHGQHVTDAFHEADFFVDNTPDVSLPSSGNMRDAIDQQLIGKLTRLVSIILHDQIRRPSTDESAMHAAYSAQLQSSCLSRQVGGREQMCLLRQRR